MYLRNYFTSINYNFFFNDRPISVVGKGQSSKWSDEEIILNINHGDREYRMSFKTNQTVKEVMMHSYGRENS